MLLQFFRDTITFQYTPESHLVTKITIQSRSTTPVYYKFKVNRPRFYLVKPDRGVIKPNQTKQIVIKLHKQGIPEANADKFKCFAVLSTAQALDQQMQKFEQRLKCQQHKLRVNINNIPSQLDIAKQTGGSELKSLAHTGMASSNVNRMSGMQTTSYQSVLSEKKQRIKNLNDEIQAIKKFNRDKKIAEGPMPQKKSSLLPFLISPVIGLVLGILTSLWV